MCFYTPVKIHALNSRSDSTPSILTLTKGLGGKSVSLSDISYLNRNKKSDSLPNIENITNETTGKYSKFRYSEKATEFEKKSPTLF